jgi:hypothetical protein
MLSNMYIQTQFSIFLINKPGVLAHTLEMLAKKKVNILAMTMMDSAEHGVLRLVTKNRDHTAEVLKGLSLTINETDVLCLTLSNQAGALAEVARKLSLEHMNITYAYCTAGARGGKTTGIIKVSDIAKAIKVLTKKGPRTPAKVTTKKKKPGNISKAAKRRAR